jgi:hypothetical protein
METLPTLAAREGLPLDSIRRMIRGNLRLAALGTKVGATRGYTRDEADAIARAWRERRARRGGKGCDQSQEVVGAH